MTAKFWGGGTGNYSDGTHWFLGTNSTGGSTTPAGSSDTATFDINSGGGTVTIDQDVTVQTITWGAFTGTIDNSANHNMTFTVGGFNGSGSGARTFLGGSGTYTLSTSGTISWTMTTVTGLTNPTTAFSSCTLTFSAAATTSALQFNAGGLTYGTVNLNANKGVSIVTGSFTITTLNITGQNGLRLQAGNTLTVTNAFNWAGTSTTPILIASSAPATGQATITTGSGTTNTASWAIFDHIAFVPVGGSTLTATNSLDTGGNTGTGFTITPPSAGGGSVGVIGS